MPRGGLTAIVGANGAGKSTLLSMIARLLVTDGGSISIGGMDIANCDSRELAKRLAILRQSNDLQSRITVSDLVGFGRFPTPADGSPPRIARPSSRPSCG